VEELQRNCHALQRFKTTVYISVSKYFQNNFKNLLHSSNYKHCIIYIRQQLAAEHKPITAQMEHKKQM
jgi:hypothetical protein